MLFQYFENNQQYSRCGRHRQLNGRSVPLHYTTLYYQKDKCQQIIITNIITTIIIIIIIVWEMVEKKIVQ